MRAPDALTPPTYYYTLAEIKTQWAKATTDERETIHDYYAGCVFTRTGTRKFRWMLFHHVPHGKTEPVLRAGYGLLKEEGITSEQMATVIGHWSSRIKKKPLSTVTQPKRGPKPLRTI